MKTSLAQRAQLYQEALSDSSIEPKTVYYHAFRTCIMSCSPFAIFQELIGDEAFAGYHHVWVYGDEGALEYDTFKRYAGKGNVRFVEAGSEGQAHALATCQYLITNAGLPSYWRKRAGQVVINTWHGTPLKSLGKDARDFMGSAIGNAQRNFLLSDYLVMPNRYTAERILDSYCIDSMFQGKILDVGSPRVDAVINSDRARTRRLLEEKHGSSLDGKKVVLYAPTFRSEGGKSVNTTDVMAGYMRELVERAPDDCVVFFKVHNTLGRFFAGNAIMSNRLIFDEIETNELLGATDVLITDYSSIFFDFICTGRPVLFFVYDKESYSAEHGMYLDTLDMPGTECKTVDDVMRCIEAIEQGSYSNPNQERARAEFAYNDDGNATRRAVDIMFRGAPAPEGAVDDRTGKASDDGLVDILVSLDNEPLLSAAMALSRLLRTFDPKRHRVTIAAHDVHLVWKECARSFPDARIVFSDIESAAKLAGAKPDAALYHELFDSFFPNMSFDAYYNLKPGRGFIDEMITCVLPSIEAHWHFCWSEKLKAAKVARDAQGYASTLLYCPHATELPKAVLDAPIEIVTDLDVRKDPDHEMAVLLIASYDSTNYALAACAEGLAGRGHRAVVSVNDTSNYVNTRMFDGTGYDIVPLKAVDGASLTFFDMVVASPLKATGQNRLYRHIERHNLMVFSFCNLFSSVAMRVSPDIVFTLGEAKNDELRAYNLRYNCVAIGNPQYDSLLGLRKPNPGSIRKVLVVEQGGYPYGEKGKRQLADMLLRIARLNPDMTFEVKPRYLPSVSKGSIHNVSEHVYDFLGECPDNLVLMTEHCTIEDIISDYDAMLTMWSTAFLDAMMMDMPLLLVGGFDSVDVFDVRTQRIDEAYRHLQATGCLRRFDEVGENIAEDFHIVEPSFAGHEVYDYRNPATQRIVGFLELAFETLVEPNLRIASRIDTTERGYYEGFADFELVDADSDSYRAAVRYRNSLNATMQERVYLNRCMGAVLDLSELEAFYDVEVPPLGGDALQSFIEDQKERLLTAFEEAKERYFTSAEGLERVKSDRVLQDFYFDWLFETGRYDTIADPPFDEVLAPESREYNLALAALARLNLPAAYSHLFEFLKMSNERPVVQLLKCKRIHKSMRPFKRGPLQPVFFAALMRPGNEAAIDMLYKEPDRMPIVALQKARMLNKTGRFEECVVFCDSALLHHSAKGKRGKNLVSTARMYAKKAFYRAIAAERERAYENAKRRAK